LTKNKKGCSVKEADCKAREAEQEAKRLRSDPSDFSSGGGYSKVD